MALSKLTAFRRTYAELAKRCAAFEAKPRTGEARLKESEEVTELLVAAFSEFTGDHKEFTPIQLPKKGKGKLWGPNGLRDAFKVGRCRLTLSKPVLKAPMVSALESII